MNKTRILVGSHAGEIITTGQISNSSAGQCLLCGTNGGPDRRVVSNDCFGKLALKMLMRYLKIDVSKVLSNSVGGADRRGERVSSHQKDEVKLEEVARTFCDGCDANVAKFWEVYQEFEAVRLLLEQSLHQIVEHLKSCRTKVTDGTLSGDVLRKCTLRLGSTTPRVRVEEIGNCYKNTIVATSEASNKISARGANEDGGEQDESVPIIKQEESDMGSTNNSDDDEDDEDNYRPASPEGCLPTTSSESDTAGATKTYLQKASECVEDESVSVAEDEVSAKAANSSCANRAKRNRNPRTNQCRICRKVFLNSKTLLLHMPCHINTMTSQACTYCSQSFIDPVEYQQHVFCNHSELFFAKELPLGTTKEKLESVLQRLLGVCDRVGENNTESVNCSMCHTPVGNPLQWRVHLWETHLPTLIEVLENKVEITKASKGLDSLLRCKYCGKTSTRSWMHRFHLKTVHSFETYLRKFPPGTNVSEQAFTQSLLNACSLVVKVVVNSNTRFQCPFCPMSGASRPACKVHILDQHLPDLISAAAATETFAMKPNRDRSRRRHKFCPSKNRKKKGKEILCLYKPCGKVFASFVARWAHSICQHPYQQLNRSKKLPKGVTEEDLLITIETILEKARLPSSENRGRQGQHQYQCTMCKPPRLLCSSWFRSHILSSRYHLHEVLARLPLPPKISNNNSNTANIKEAIVPNPIPREGHDDVVLTLKGEGEIDEDDDEDEMDVPSSDPLLTADNIVHGDDDDTGHVAEDEDMELQ